MIGKSTIGIIAAAVVIAMWGCAAGNIRGTDGSTYISPNTPGSAPGARSGRDGRAIRSGDDSAGSSGSGSR